MNLLQLLRSELRDWYLAHDRRCVLRWRIRYFENYYDAYELLSEGHDDRDFPKPHALDARGVFLYVAAQTHLAITQRSILHPVRVFCGADRSLDDLIEIGSGRLAA